MGTNQGFLRLTKGISKKLTKSEAKRGYLFISNDNKVKNLSLDIFINGERLGNKKIDNSGRIIIGMKNTSKIGNKEYTLSLKQNTLEISF